VISHVGTPPTATLSGSYQFLSGTTFPFTFSESDTVSISAAPPDHAFVGVFGGGVRWHASSRWGLRFEVRGHVNRNTARTLVDANPTRTGAPSGGVSTIAVTTAALQFSTVSAIRSSLSGPRLDGYETYQGRGTEGHVSYSAGMFWRF